MKLTRAAVAKITLPAGQSEAIIWDDDVPGFGLRLRAGGSRNWIFQYRLGRKQGRVGLGSASAISAQDARAQAGKMHAKVKLGHDPAAQKAEAVSRAAETFEAAMDIYLPRQQRRLRPRSFVEIDRHLRKHAKTQHREPLASIDRRKITALMPKVGQASGEGAANRMRASLSGFFAWCMREGLTDHNPVVGSNKFEESAARNRVLSDAELAAIWKATGDGGDYSSIVRRLILSGARRDEIGALRWSEVDLDKALITVPAERMKNHHEFVVPLSPAALAILKTHPRREGRDYVFGRGGRGAEGAFSGWSKAKAALDKRSAPKDPDQPQMPTWVLHDIRRSVSTTMNERLGILPHVVEAVLSHTIQGVAGVYNRSAYLADKRAALLRWAEHVASIVEDREPKIVALHA